MVKHKEKHFGKINIGDLDKNATKHDTRTYIIIADLNFEYNCQSSKFTPHQYTLYHLIWYICFPSCT